MYTTCDKALYAACTFMYFIKYCGIPLFSCICSQIPGGTFLVYIGIKRVYAMREADKADINHSNVC